MQYSGILENDDNIYYGTREMIHEDGCEWLSSCFVPSEKGLVLHTWSGRHEVLHLA
jgi:hypothetical protein